MVVYCEKCGAKNEEGVERCVQCGNLLYASRTGRTKAEEEMCFGLPKPLGTLVIGVFIIIIGVWLLIKEYYKIPIELWPLILILLGILVIIGAIYGIRQKK
ncbi:MAG: hypothetical protein QXG01_07295 [Candidatus Bathyarchaeia archaeon]